MLSDVWMKMAQFLGTLNGENINRESYVHTPEYENALEAWKIGRNDPCPCGSGKKWKK